MLAGLCVGVYDLPGEKAGKPAVDLVYLSGVVVTIIQLGISIIPWILFEDWIIFLITSTGTALAIALGCLPQWRSKKTVALTRGDGAQHVILINRTDETSLLADSSLSPRRDTIRVPWPSFGWYFLLP